MPGLGTVPTEILLLVAEDLSCSDLNSLIQANSSFLTSLRPVLDNRAFRNLKYLLTAFFYAAANNDKRTIKVLLGRMIEEEDPRLRYVYINDTGFFNWDPDSPTSFHPGSLEIGVNYMIACGTYLELWGSISAIAFAAAHGDVKMWRDFTRRGLKPPASPSKRWERMLNMAVLQRQQSIEIIKDLLPKGCGVPGTFRHLPRAVRNGHWELALLLLEAGADVNTLDSFECTALFYSVYAKDADMTERLLAAGADYFGAWDPMRNPRPTADDQEQEEHSDVEWSDGEDGVLDFKQGPVAGLLNPDGVGGTKDEEDGLLIPFQPFPGRFVRRYRGGEVRITNVDDERYGNPGRLLFTPSRTDGIKSPVRVDISRTKYLVLSWKEEHIKRTLS